MEISCSWDLHKTYGLSISFSLEINTIGIFCTSISNLRPREGKANVKCWNMSKPSAGCKCLSRMALKDAEE